jgi:hypothetical protein
MPSRARQPAEFSNQRLLSEFSTYRAKAHQAPTQRCWVAWQNGEATLVAAITAEERRRLFSLQRESKTTDEKS